MPIPLCEYCGGEHIVSNCKELKQDTEKNPLGLSKEELWRREPLLLKIQSLEDEVKKLKQSVSRKYTIISDMHIEYHGLFNKYDGDNKVRSNIHLTLINITSDVLVEGILSYWSRYIVPTKEEMNEA